MSCGCRERAPRKSLCDALEEAGGALPIVVEQTALGVQFLVAHQGRMLELFDAVETYRCHLANGRAVRRLARHLPKLQAAAAGIAGRTITLNQLSLMVPP